MPITEIAHHFKKVAKRLGMMTGWYGLGRKWSWPSFRYYPGICLERLGETMKNPCQDSWYPDWYSNQVPFNPTQVLWYWCHVFLFQQLALSNTKWLHKGAVSSTANKK
jgi:hypothetical protein